MAEYISERDLRVLAREAQRDEEEIQKQLEELRKEELRREKEKQTLIVPQREEEKEEIQRQLSELRRERERQTLIVPQREEDEEIQRQLDELRRERDKHTLIDPQREEEEKQRQLNELRRERDRQTLREPQREGETDIKRQLEKLKRERDRQTLSEMTEHSLENRNGLNPDGSYQREKGYTSLSRKEEFETPFSPKKPDSCRRIFFDNKTLRVHSKRRLESLDDIALSSSTKRRKLSDAMDHQASDCPSPMSSIIQAVNRLSTDSDLVADGSRVNSLPTIPGKHSDLNAISPQTMKDLLNGSHDNDIDQVTVIDCRYPYEYDGGHIKGAKNLYRKDSIEKFIHETEVTSQTNHVLIFHCEFSSERGPKMYRFLRCLDRGLNKDSYPRLNFPEVYLLAGGYKAFYEVNQSLCNPKSYKPMLHKQHADDLRHFRVKSKSWAAGDKPRHKSRADSGGVKLSF